MLFSVSDKQNRYINDLTKEDVTILEDGKPQQIFTFKREFDLPLTMALLIDVSGSERYTLPLLKDAGYTVGYEEPTSGPNVGIRAYIRPAQCKT